MSEIMSRQIITETLLSLLNVVIELNVTSVSICKGDSNSNFNFAT